jgi:hypothetical protein
MFLRVPLAESFAHLATPEEWETFQSFGRRTGTDRWISSFDTLSGPSSIRGSKNQYEVLRATFVARAHQRLRSGEWIGEGFNPAQGPNLQPIPKELWSFLEFDHYEDEVSGAGYKFVGLQLSASQGSGLDAVPVPARSGKVPLGEALELAATAEELVQYAGLKSAASSPLIWVIGASETEYEQRHRLCRELQMALWKRILPKLLRADWNAEGFIALELQRTRIPAELWPELQCNFHADEVYSGPELGLRFHKVLIDLGPAPQLSETPGTTRRSMITWLQTIAGEQREPVRRVNLLAEARAALGDETISLNMLNECVRTTGLGEALLFKGRPPN